MMEHLSRPLRAGLYGAGAFGRFVVRALATNLWVRVTAVASRTQARATALARDEGIDRAHASYESLLGDPELDLVVIATPPSEHAAQALAALSAGKHVLLEKPLATTLEDAERLVEVRRRVNRLRPGTPAPPPTATPARKAKGPGAAPEASPKAPAQPAPKPAARATARPKLSKDAYRRRREALDAELARLGLRRSQLDLAMGQPSVAANFVEMRRVTSELADVERALAAAEDAWLELEEQAP